MLRTTNKKVKQKLIADVLENFWPKNFGGGEVGLQNLKNQIDSMRYNNRSIYQTALDYVEGGSYLIYYYDIQDYLHKLLEWEPGVDPDYSDDKAWKLYCHLIARTMAGLYEDRVKELERLN